MVESKAYGKHGPTKTDVFVFDRKTFDLALARHQAGVRGPHWRVLASLSPVDAQLRKYCYLHGLIVADPKLLPLPLLLRAAARPNADRVADSVLWDELVRLGERAVVPFEIRYSLSDLGLTFDIHRWAQRDLEDLLYVQSTLSEQVLASVDELQPSYFADRAATLLAHVGSTALRSSPLRSA
jgi:hypothetical protein